MPPAAMPPLGRLAMSALHVLSLMFWIGSLVSITRVLAAAQGEAGTTRDKLASSARKLYRVVASPWMGLALISGGFLALTSPRPAGALAAGASGLNWLFTQGWWHAKLAGALALLALHFVLGARVRRAQREDLTENDVIHLRGVQVGVLVVTALTVSAAVIWKRARVPACPAPPSTTLQIHAN